MEAKVGTLVIVFPNEGIPAEQCWGIIEVVYPSGHFLVHTEKSLTPRGIELPEKLIIEPAYLIPVVNTDKSFKSARIAATRSAEKMLLRLFSEIFPKKKAFTNLAELTEGTLVIVTNDDDHQEDPCWGVVKKIMPDGVLDVTLGRKFAGLFRDRAFIKPKNLIPILKTTGRILSVKRVVAKNLNKILMIALIHWLQKEGQDSQPKA